VHPDHRHWHLIGFARYALRPVGAAGGAIRLDRKTGFCLGDRYEGGGRGARRTAAFARGAVAGRLITRAHFDQDCGRDQPRLLRVVEGISVGYGDDYKPFLEGQFIDITAVPAGRYLLVHRANVERRIEEANYQDNAASVLVAISRRGGRPGVRVLRSCPGTIRCAAIG
jgi:hypothetical protein